MRRGLLEALYNLNHADNSLMLPMDRQVGRAIGLPLHQASWLEQGHASWSEYVRSEIEPIFSQLKDQMEAHKVRDYASVKTELETKARNLRKEILNSGASTLDALAEEKMAGP